MRARACAAAVRAVLTGYSSRAPMRRRCGPYSQGTPPVHPCEGRVLMGYSANANARAHAHTRQDTHTRAYMHARALARALARTPAHTRRHTHTHHAQSHRIALPSRWPRLMKTTQKSLPGTGPATEWSATPWHWPCHRVVRYTTLVSVCGTHTYTATQIFGSLNASFVSLIAIRPHRHKLWPSQPYRDYS